MKKGMKIFGKIYIYLVLLLMYLPIFVIIVFSFTRTTNIGQWNGFTFSLYVTLFQHEKIMSALLNTLIIALSSALVSTILGTLGAMGVYYTKRKRTKQVIEAINEIPIVNAEIVIAISLAILFRLLVQMFAAMGIKTTSPSFFTLLVGHVVLSISFVYLSVKPKLMQLDPREYEAALDLGAKPFQALMRIVMPAIIPGILSGFMLAFTLSLDDYVITSFLRVPTFDTISTYVQGVIVKSSIPPELRALTTLIFLITLGAVLIANHQPKSGSLSRYKKRLKMRKGETK